MSARTRTVGPAPLRITADHAGAADSLGHRRPRGAKLPGDDLRGPVLLEAQLGIAVEVDEHRAEPLVVIGLDRIGEIGRRGGRGGEGEGKQQILQTHSEASGNLPHPNGYAGRVRYANFPLSRPYGRGGAQAEGCGR